MPCACALLIRLVALSELNSTFLSLITLLKKADALLLVALNGKNAMSYVFVLIAFLMSASSIVSTFNVRFTALPLLSVRYEPSPA